MIFSYFSSETDNRPARSEAPWEQIAYSLSDARRSACTTETCRRSECPHKKGPAWCAAAWPEGAKRNKATVLEVGALILDFDHLPGTVALERALEPLNPYRRIVHASHSDRADDRCVRVVLALSRPVQGDDWPRFWLAAVKFLRLPTTSRSGDGGVDLGTKDASRLFFLPSRPQDADFYYEVHDGQELDVDAILETIGLAPPKPRTQPQAIPSGEGPEFAVEVLARAWPERGRHHASLALCGALAHARCSEDEIAEFVTAVCAMAAYYRGDEHYDGEPEKRAQQAASSVAKIAAGDHVSGWPTLETLLGNAAAVTAAREALGLGPTILAEQVKSELQASQRRLARSTRPDRAFAGRLLSKVLQGKSPDVSERDREGAEMIRVVVDEAPPMASPRQLADVLCRALAWMNPDAIVAEVERLRAERKAAVDKIESGVDPANDEELREALKKGDKGPFSWGTNVEKILRFAEDLRGRLRFNEVTRAIEVSEGPFAREKANDLHVAVMNWLEEYWGFSVGADIVKAQLLRTARVYGSYDPIARYLRTLKWDETPRIDTWLATYCGVDDNPYSRKVAARFLIGAVARGLDPGCKVDTVMVLEGAQGAKKSTALRMLGSPWFSDTALIMGDKDSRMLAGAKWIIELAELASFSNREHETVKAFLSSPQDDFRPPYGAVIESFLRRCVFVGTTNEHEYLADHTGNRRYLPVRVGRLDVEAIARDRDQLWAEAVYRYDACERWWFEPDEQIAADVEIAERRQESPWIPMIQDWAARQAKMMVNGEVRNHWTLGEVGVGALGLNAAEVKRFSKDISIALREAGFESRRVYVGKVRVRRWVPAGQEELPAMQAN